VEQPFVALFFLENPVDFGAMDGEPVSVLFPIASPTIRGHLQLVSKISFVLRDPTFLRVLHEQASRECILSSLKRVEECMDNQRRVPERDSSVMNMPV
jgi:PTS system nitrogen regulatory IIA component